MDIKIVGSIADKDEIHLIKNTTEIFLIEQIIKNMNIKNEEEISPIFSV